MLRQLLPGHCNAASQVPQHHQIAIDFLAGCLSRRQESCSLAWLRAAKRRKAAKCPLKTPGARLTPRTPKSKRSGHAAWLCHWHEGRRGGHARQACYPIQRAWAMPEGRPAQPSPWLWVSVAAVPGLCRTRAAPVAITTALVNPARAAARASPRQLSQRGRAQKGLFGLIFMISIMAELRLETKRREVCSCAAETSGRAWPCGAGCGRLRGAHIPPVSWQQRAGSLPISTSRDTEGCSCTSRALCMAAGFSSAAEVLPQFPLHLSSNISPLPTVQTQLPAVSPRVGVVRSLSELLDVSSCSWLWRGCGFFRRPEVSEAKFSLGVGRLHSPRKSASSHRRTVGS